MAKVQEFIDGAYAESTIRTNVAQRLARIRAATIEECAEKSYRLASVAAIAKRARVSTASLYRDFGSRENLLEQVALFTAPLIAADFSPVISDDDPKGRLLKLLLQHGGVFQNPHANWVYRAHVSGEVLGGKGLLRIGESATAQIEAFWINEIEALQRAGLIVPLDVRQTLNALLGPVQRRTLLSMLLFGPRDSGAPDLEAAARAGVDWLFDTYGTEHQNDLSRTVVLAPLDPQLPAKSYLQMRVEADLALDPSRGDAATRKRKILAAAAQECSEVGYKFASMAGVARRAGVSTATLYLDYSNKEQLFLQGVSYIFSIMNEAITEGSGIKDPAMRIATMLVDHGKFYLDPFMSWLFRLYVSFEGQSDSVFGQIGQISRDVVEQYWRKQLLELEQQGYLRPSDHTVTINIMLGAVERPTLGLFLLMGHLSESYPGLLEAARGAALALFSRYGTLKFFEEYGDKPSTSASKQAA